MSREELLRLAEADLLTMDARQRLVLARMSSDLGYPFRDIAADCGMDEQTARAIVRHFHKLGLASYGRLYSEDEPKVAGSGYWLSNLGMNLQRQMKSIIGWRDLCAAEEAAIAKARANQEPGQ